MCDTSQLTFLLLPGYKNVVKQLYFYREPFDNLTAWNIELLSTIFEIPNKKSIVKYF